MIIKCTECGLQVSDKAYSCPHCGLPMRNYKPVRRNSRKRRRLPNGFGQITELKNQNLRNRFRVMITVGKTSTGKPICKLLKPKAYYPTYNDAYQALLEYNKNPYDLDDSINVKELYERWTESYFKTLKSPASIRTITSAWAYCSSVHDIRAKDLRARHIKQCIDEGMCQVNGIIQKPSPGVKRRIKSLFNLMLDYAIEYELVDKNYARTFNISNNIIRECDEMKRSHIPFNNEEINKLWEHVLDVKYVDSILIQCYTGLRPQELCNIEVSNINTDEWYLVGGMKTDAGTNRIIPIHERIKPLVIRRINESKMLGTNYLINCTDSRTSDLKMTYDKYQKRFNKVVEQLKLNPDHRAHDCRVHFITIAKRYNLDEYAIKRIVGHSISDITERVYTKRDTSWLISEMSKIE